MLFGYKPPFDNFNRIPPEEINRNNLIVTENNVLLQDKNNNQTRFDQIHIKRSDMKRRFKEISSRVKENL